MAKAYLTHTHTHTHTHTLTQRHKYPLNLLSDPCPGRPTCASPIALWAGLKRPRLPTALYHCLGSITLPRPARLFQTLATSVAGRTTCSERVSVGGGEVCFRAHLKPSCSPHRATASPAPPPRLSPPDQPRHHLLTSPVKSRKPHTGTRPPFAFPSSQAPRSGEVYVSRNLFAPNYPRSLGLTSAWLRSLLPKTVRQLIECVRIEGSVGKGGRGGAAGGGRLYEEDH